MLSAFRPYAQNRITNVSSKTEQQMNNTQLQTYQKVQSQPLH